jgi:hypothetical protein
MTITIIKEYKSAKNTFEKYVHSSGVHLYNLVMNQMIYKAFSEKWHYYRSFGNTVSTVN